LARELDIAHRDDEYLQKRQIFITANYYLCVRVKDYFNRLKESVDHAGERISKAQFNEYIRRRGTVVNANVANDVMLEEGDEFNNIPDSFRQLTEAHFPLFITFEKFMRMLQGTYGIDLQKLTVRPELDTGDEDDVEGSRRRLPFIKKEHFVNYNLFRKRYWDHFDHDSKRNLDCGLVYSEFAVIKVCNCILKNRFFERCVYI